MKKIKAEFWKALLVAGALAAFAGPAAADMVGTDQVVQQQSDRDKVRAFLERKDAEKQLGDMGVSPELAKQRVDAMTDAEVRVVAAKIDSLPAGAALSQNDWIIVILLLILVVILV
jgi:uncharacterized protein DUF6627